MKKNLKTTIQISGYLAVSKDVCGQPYVQFLPDEPQVGLVEPFAGQSRAQMLSNGTFDCLKRRPRHRNKPALKLPHSSLSFGADGFTRYVFTIADNRIDEIPRLLMKEANQVCKFIDNLLKEE